MYLVRVYLPYCISLSLPPPHTGCVGGGHGKVGVYLRESREVGICEPGGGSHDIRVRDMFPFLSCLGQTPTFVFDDRVCLPCVFLGE